MDGYRSTSRNYIVARNFAARAESDERAQVILKITLENKKGKYYFCLDKRDYTMYLDEEEVLLQAGLIGQVQNVSVSDDGEITQFDLYIPDKLVEKEKQKRERDYVLPVLIYAISELYQTPWNIYFVTNQRIQILRSFELWNNNLGKFEDEEDPEFIDLKDNDPTI